MDTFLNLDKKERKQIFEEATARHPTIETPAIMEKHFSIPLGPVTAVQILAH